MKRFSCNKKFYYHKNDSSGDSQDMSEVCEVYNRESTRNPKNLSCIISGRKVFISLVWPIPKKCYWISHSNLVLKILHPKNFIQYPWPLFLFCIGPEG